MPKPQEWDYQLKSEPNRVRPMVLEIMKRLDGYLPSQAQEEREDLKLIFSELLYNAVIHGNTLDKQKMVQIRVKADEQAVSADISDEGSGYNYPMVIAQMKKGEHFHKETGRGMILVLALADEVSVSQNGSHVTFVKRIGDGHGR